MVEKEEKSMSMDEAVKKQEQNKKDREERERQERNTSIYLAIRGIQVLCIGVFVFGALWEGTERFSMTTPQFLMTYGAAGAVISEVLARVFKKKILK